MEKGTGQKLQGWPGTGKCFVFVVSFVVKLEGCNVLMLQCCKSVSGYGVAYTNFQPTQHSQPFQLPLQHKDIIVLCIVEWH